MARGACRSWSPPRSRPATVASVIHAFVTDSSRRTDTLAPMFLFTEKTRMPEPDKALPGRAEPIPTAERHFLNGASLTPPYPAGTEVAEFALGCCWGEEK